jgi:hypothetical protein
MERFSIKLVRRLFSNLLRVRSKTGAIVESREPIGALKRKLRILMRDLSNKWDLCSPRDKPRNKIGATVASREPTGALKKRPKTSTRDQSNNKDSFSPKELRRDGAIDKSAQIPGAMMRLRMA